MTNPKWLIGRTIVGASVSRRPARDNGSEIAHSWVLDLDNGAQLAFFPEETDYDEAGVDIIYRKPVKRGRRRAP